LGSGDDSAPKILLKFGGGSLLERHLAILHACGVAEAVIVIGFAADRIREEVARIGPAIPVSFIENPRFAEGSVVSLAAAEREMTRGEPVLLMDGDVLYDRRLMERLVRTRIGNCLLMDRTIEPGDEPVKLCIRGMASPSVSSGYRPPLPKHWPVARGTMSRAGAAGWSTRNPCAT
jgi:choline kinase